MSTYTQKSLNFQLFKTKLLDMGNLTEKYKQAICMFPAVDPSLMIGLFQQSMSTAEIQFLKHWKDTSVLNVKPFKRNLTQKFNLSKHVHKI